MFIFKVEESMNILYKLMLSLSVLAFWACTSNEDTIYTAQVTGSEVYKRHLAKGDEAVMDCKVYAADASVSVDVVMNLRAYDNSIMTMTMVTEVGDPSWYTAEIELSGMLMSEYDETCESITQSLESAGGKVKCSGSGIRGELKLPAITNPVKVQSVVSETIEEGKEKCDNLFNTYKKVFAGFDGAWDYGESTVNVEKAQSCDVNFANDTVYLNVIYSSKSLVMKTTLDNPVTFHTTEEYTGLDDETLVQICDAHLHDEDIYSMTAACNGPWFAYSHSTTVEGETLTLEDLAVLMKKGLCPALLDGSMGLEDVWSN